jgi:hypothetical protein
MDLEHTHKKAFYEGVINFIDDGITIGLKERLSTTEKKQIEELIYKNGLAGSVDEYSVMVLFGSKT